MAEQFIKPKTYMILSRRASGDTSFCELAGVKNSLRNWGRYAYIAKKNHEYLIYKFNEEVTAYELKFDGQSVADLFIDGLSPKETEDTLHAIFTPL